MVDPFDDRWPEGGVDGDGELLDRRLRAELWADLGPAEDPVLALEALAPEMARAVRVRRTRTVLATAALIVAFVGGGAFAVSLATSLTSERNGSVTMAGEADEVAESTVGSTAGHTTIEVDVADGVAPTSPTEGGQPPATGGDPTTTGEGGTSRDETTAPSSTGSTPTTSPSGSSTSATSTGTDLTTTTSTSLGAGQSLVRSDCGDIVVGVQASSVTLVDLDPDSGYRTDVKSSGPSRVEVGFEGSGGHCEVSARVENGELVTSVDDDDGDEHHDDD